MRSFPLFYFTRRVPILLNGLIPKCCNSTGPTEQNVLDSLSPKSGGFAKAFLKHSTLEPESKEDEPFVKLLRNSKFIDLGNPEGKIVSGIIFHIVNDDLYIDFGGKFHCVCTRPVLNSSSYVRGARVRLKLKELEMSTKFLGSDKDLTLLEADAVLLGLISTGKKD